MTKPTKRSTAGTPTRRAGKPAASATAKGEERAQRAAESPAQPPAEPAKRRATSRRAKAATPAASAPAMSPAELAAALNAREAADAADDVAHAGESSTTPQPDAAVAPAEATASGEATSQATDVAPASIESEPAVGAEPAGGDDSAGGGERRDDDAPELPFAERVRSRVGTADVLVFRVGGELFGAALAAIEEALELPNLSHLPEMPRSMLGVISLRGRMLPAYSPARPLGVALARADAAALVVKAGERRVALAVDDVDDVLTVDLAELRPPPIVGGEERDAVLLGVAGRNGELVAVLDADALVTACLSDQALETA